MRSRSPDPAIATLHGPARSTLQHHVHFSRDEIELALASDARGDLSEQALRKFQGFNVGASETGQKCANAAGDVEAHTPGTDDTPASGSNAATPPIGKP